jgi:hypothetical protein
VGADLYKQFVKKSSDMALDKAVIMVHGQSGIGKSLLMASASEHFPADLDNRKDQPVAILKDVCWVGFDRGATASLIDKRIDIPHEIDVLGLLDSLAGDLEKTLRIIPELVRALVVSEGLRYVVMGDTLSELDRMLNSFWGRTVSEEYGRLSGKVSAEHRNYFDAMRTLPVVLLGSFHQQAVLDFSDPKKSPTANEKALKEARGVGGEMSMVVPEVTGRAKSLYVGQADMELAMFGRPDARNVFRRWVRTRPSPEMRAKSRWSDHVGEIEPANLRPILEKIRGGIKEVRGA